ncbi:hypothetical protein CCACVL1_14798 [Corchorus capsularis]|uniref:MSP domain-containing protein n=1 Tax=Corchorus capsularis TaxID=210143 RepID=A0A1R3I5H7_COCAP|nr:hypothetical protein CCACVL1_14798 [Corchorus capsularis]
MDRLVKSDVKEVELVFKRGQKSSTTFRLTNLMHTMSVAVSLTTQNPSFFSFNKPFSILPPLSSSSYTLLISQPSDQPPLVNPPDAITVKTTMLPLGKAHNDDLRNLFSKPGPHLFKDATLPISFVGPHVIEHLISSDAQIEGIDGFLNKAISGCTGNQVTELLKSAVVSGKANLVSTLIDHGGDVNEKDSKGRSLISLAVQAGDFDVANVLISSGCQIDNSVDHVLQYAAAINRVDLIELLFKAYKNILDLNSVALCGRTPIHVAASQGYTEVIQFCLSVGGNPEILDVNGCTPLHLAAQEGHLEAVECLLEASSYVKYALNKQGKTAFALAVENGHSNLYDVLHLGDSLNRAARIDNVNGIKSCLAEGANVNGKDQNGWTPLHRAAFKGRIESVKALLNHGAMVNLVDDNGYTPLHCAVEAGHAQVALLLIAHGAKANLKGLKLKGVVPLNSDCFKNHPTVFQPLLCHEKEQT